MRKLILITIIVFAFLVRVVAIDRFPTGFTQDEAGLGYDAYSLYKTGRDEWGKILPVTLRSFGDFKLPLYSYLTVPSVAIFGLNEFAVRFPNGIIGTFAVLVTYLLIRKLSSREDLAIWSAILLTISPWHISLSRGAFEANLTTFLLPLGLWTFLLGLERPRLMMVSALVFGLNLFSYHSGRLFTPIFILLLFIFERKEIKASLGKSYLKNIFRKYLLALSALLLFFIVAFYSVFNGAGKRASDVMIANPTDKWSTVADRRYEAVKVGLPDPIARLFSNKLTYISGQFTANYLSYLSPTFLFIQGAGEWTYGMIQGRGLLYSIELVFLVIGFIYFIKGRGFRGMNFIIAWIILSPIPAALAKGPGFAANRAAIMMPAIQIISAFGLVSLGIILSDLFRNKSFQINYALAVLIILLFSFASFAEGYLYHAPKNAAPSMHYGIRDMMLFISNIEDNYRNIIISRSLSVPQIWVAFYKKWDPADFQKESSGWLRYEKEGKGFVDQLGEYKLGKYIFSGIDRGLRNGDKSILYVGKPDEFGLEVKPLKVIYYPDDKPAYYIVEGQSL